MEKEKDRKIHITLPAEVHKQLRISCAVEDCTIQNYVANLITDNLGVNPEMLGAK